MLRRTRHLAGMLRNEKRSPEALRLHQNRHLIEIVRHAATSVPYYRTLYLEHGLDIDNFRGLDDLSHLPIVDKRSLRAAGSLVLMHDHPAPLSTITTSGSTGVPYRFPVDQQHNQWRKAQYLRPYLSNGRSLRHKVLRLTAFPVERRTWFSALGLLREWQFDSAAEPDRILAAWRTLRPAILQGYPSSLLTLAHHLLEQNVRLDPAPLRVFTDSELLRPDTRRILEQVFGTAPIDIFGTYETDNIAWQCAERTGFHVALDSVVLEIVRDGASVPDGEEGELVATVLSNRTHPFIRYRLGDIGRLSTRACTCGRIFPLLEITSGRADDMVELADGKRMTAVSVLGRLDGFASHIRHYQLRQLALDRFEILIVPSRSYTEAVAGQILCSLQEPLQNASVSLQVLDAVPRDPSGKLRAFICAIKN